MDLATLSSARQRDPLSLADLGAAFGTGSPAETAGQPSGLRNLLSGLYDSLGGLAKRSFGASEEMRAGGAYNPAPAVEAAMLPMGTGAVAGVPLDAGEAVLGAGPIRAYHGSPHDFDAFDLSKIGTGEGAQAYGHGLYFAEREGVAKNYKDVLSQIKDTRPAHEQVASDAIERFGSREAALNQLQDVVRARESGVNKPWGEYFPYHDEASLATDLLKNPEWQPKKIGHMYEVNINADPAHFLDWDKPLSEQPGVASKLGFSPRSSDEINAEAEALFAKHGQYPNMPPEAKARIGELQAELDKRAPDVTGADYYRQSDPNSFLHSMLTSGNSMPERSSQLAQSGIPGIKYLDQGSRTAGQGSSNYVVFNDKLIDIVRKYAAAGIALPPAIAAQYKQMQDSQ